MGYSNRFIWLECKNIAVYNYKVEACYDGYTLGDYLRHIHKFSSRIITKLKLDKSYMLCNNEHIRMIDKIYKGDLLKVTLIDVSHVKKNPSLFVDIAYEDDEVIVFNKPHNMPSHPSRNHKEDTLANYFAYYTEKMYNTTIQFRPINRLDRDTSGLVVVAKTALAASRLNNCLKKEYTAVVSGIFPYKKGVIDAPIYRPDNFFIKREVNVLGQKSITEYKLVATNEKYSLLSFNLITGRTHQIRVHMSYLGYPLVGDDMYNGDTSCINIQALCCNKVIFPNNNTNKMVEVCINIPPYIDNLMYNAEYL